MEMETERNYLWSQREDQHPEQGQYSHQDNVKAYLAYYTTKFCFQMIISLSRFAPGKK